MNSALHTIFKLDISAFKLLYDIPVNPIILLVLYILLSLVMAVFIPTKYFPLLIIIIHQRYLSLITFSDQKCYHLPHRKPLFLEIPILTVSIPALVAR